MRLPDPFRVGAGRGREPVQHQGEVVAAGRLLRKRDPHDIDPVTFFHSPAGEDQESLLRASPRIFDPLATREDHRVDAYFVELNATAPESLVAQSAYWNSLWSHRRNGQWKGYLRVDLAPVDDEAARANLDLLSNE